VLPKKSLRFLFAIILLPLLITSCNGAAPSGTYVWIDVPVDGLSYPDVQPVNVEGHATGNDSITRVELYVDGDLWSTIEDPPTEDTLANFQAEWLPPGPGSYTIHAIAYGSDGAPSEYDETHIRVGLETPTPVITVTPTLTYTPTPVISITPTLTDTPTPLPMPETNVLFWADPETIDAGACTDIHWQAQGVKNLVFGGVEQAMEGVFQTCLCKNETYTLTATNLDDSVEKLKVNINVVGTCGDNTPPPAPVQQVPSNGLSIACKSYQNLVWLPVSDESGISQYQVKAQRHSGDNNWTNVAGSTFNGITGKSYNMYVECGWYYRWQVRAVDGEGNVGPWSNWWQFVINLN
jgi:hypothetical protein